MLTPSTALVPTDVLIDTIVTRFHAPLPAQLKDLEALATKVARVHGGGDARLHELDAAVQGLVDSLNLHIAEEERDVFPLLRQGASSEQLREPVRSMQFEHEGIVAMFERMRFLTDDFTRPPNACTSYRKLFDGLEALEREVREHVALEDELASRFQPAR